MHESFPPGRLRLAVEIERVAAAVDDDEALRRPADAQQRREAAGLDSAAGWVDAVAMAEASGTDRKSAIAEVAKRAGIPRREVYDAVVKAKTAGSAGEARP